MNLNWHVLRPRLMISAAAVVLAVIAASCTDGGKPADTSTTSSTVAGSTASTLDVSTSSTLPPGASVKVPKLVGRYYFHAKRILEIQGLTYQALKTYKGGNGRRVLKQTPAAGTEVPGGYQISLVLQPPAPKGGRKITSLDEATGAGDSSSGTDGATTGGSSDPKDSSGTTSTTSADDAGSTTTTQAPGKSTTTTVPETNAKFSVVSSGWGSALVDPSINFTIKNVGDAKAYCVKVTARLEDSSGNVLESSTELAAPVSVAPGAKAYGRVVFPGLGATSGTIKYLFSWKDSSSQCSAIPIKVVSKEFTSLPTGRKAIYGLIKNDTSSTPNFGYVLAVAFGSGGKILEIVLVEIDYLFLGPGQTTSYLAEFDYTRSMSSYTVISQGLLP